MKKSIIESIPYADFAKVYRVFSEPPYNEKWSSEELEQEFESLSKLGHVCGYYENGECIGLMTFRRMIPNEHPVSYPSHINVIYISDMAVLSAHRRKGIGSKLMRYALETAKSEGFDIAYMRTLPKGQSMSYNIAVRLGLTPIENVFQPVYQERNVDERAETDNRIFLDVNLNNWW